MSGVLAARERDTGALILLIAAAAAVVVAIFYFFWPYNGIHGTPGAGLVVISSALMAAAAALLVFARLGRGLRGTLLVLIALDILGTGFAAYLLEANWLLAAMAVALFGWIVHLASGPSRLGTSKEPVA